MEAGANGWTTGELTSGNTHWHYTSDNFHGASGMSLVANYEAGPKAGKYGHWWEETAEMTDCYNVPASPAAEPYIQLWNATDTQSSVDGGYVQMQIGQGSWLDIYPYNPFGPPPPPPPLGYRGKIDSSTLILSDDHEAFTGNVGWTQSEIFPLWSQNVGEINNTCVRFRFWFASDGSNPEDHTGWYVDDFVFHDGNSIAFQDNFNNAGSGNWQWANQMVVDDTNGFEQLDGAGVDKSVAWWVGNLTQNKYINGTDHYLVSPTIDLTGGGMNEARFTYWQKYNITNKDGGWVEISTNGGATWNYIEPLFDLSTPDNIVTKYPGYIDSNSDYGKIGAFTGNESWHKMAFDLTPYIGSNVKIRFHFYANWDDINDKGWFIDDFEVKSWQFTADGDDSHSLNAVNSGAKATASVNYPFDTETDWRIRVVLPSDDDTSNDELHAVVRVKNVRDFSITPKVGGGFIQMGNHGAEFEYQIQVTNTGNLDDDYNVSLDELPADWTYTFNMNNTGNLRPGDPPFLIVANVQTTVGSGPTDYPDLTKQSFDYTLNFSAESTNDQSINAYKHLTARVTNTKPSVSFLGDNLPAATVYSPMSVDFSRVVVNDDDVDPVDELTYLWDWGDGTPEENTTTWPVTHTYTASTKTLPYLVTLKVTDGLATSDEATINVSVKNEPPTAKFVIETIATNNTYAAGDPITFNATAPEYTKDENPAGLTFLWDFGDGNSGEGAFVNHTYDDGGVKSVNLTVMDEEDAIAYADKNVSINTPPTAVITSPANLETYTLGEEIEFNASESSDNEQAKKDLDFLWISNKVGEIGNQMVFKKTFSSDASLGNHQITLEVRDRKAKGYSYTVRNIVIVERPQNRPALELDPDSKKALEPAGGFISTSVFTFRILYKDIDNDRPSFVRLVLDAGTEGQKTYDLAQYDPSNRDYKNGVLFTTSIPGNGIGADRVHSFYFETADERNDTVVVKSDTYTGPRITREKLVQNEATSEIPSGVAVAFAKVRYVGKQDQKPVKLTVTRTHSTPAPTAHPKPVGLFVTMQGQIESSLWDYANLSFKYGSTDFEDAVKPLNLSSVSLYKLSGGTWQLVEDAINDENGLIVSYNDVTEEGTYGLFAKERPPDCVGDECNGPDTTQGFLEAYGGLLLVLIVVLVIIVVAAVMFRKKKVAESKWGGDDAIDLKIDIISGEGTEDVEKAEGVEAAKAEDVAPDGAVPIYRPGGEAEPEPEIESSEEVPVYRPGGAVGTVVGEEEAPPEEWQPPAAEEPVEPTAEEPAVWQPPAAEEPAEPAEEPPETPEKAEKPEGKKDDDQDLLDEILGED
jgi:hypothetical protein